MPGGARSLERRHPEERERVEEGPRLTIGHALLALRQYVVEAVVDHIDTADDRHGDHQPPTESELATGELAEGDRLRVDEGGIALGGDRLYLAVEELLSVPRHLLPGRPVDVDDDEGPAEPVARHDLPAYRSPLLGGVWQWEPEGLTGRQANGVVGLLAPVGAPGLDHRGAHLPLLDLPRAKGHVQTTALQVSEHHPGADQLPHTGCDALALAGRQGQKHPQVPVRLTAKPLEYVRGRALEPHASLSRIGNLWPP